MRRALPFCSLVALIFVLSAVGRPLQKALKAEVGSGGMLLIAALGTLLFGFGLLCSMKRRALSQRARNTAGVLTLLLLAAVLVLRENPEEAFHFLEYGLLGYTALVWLAPADRRPGHFVLAAFLASLVGVAEECLQGVLPGRFFDLRDIRFNTEAVCLVLVVLALMSHQTKETP